MARRPPAAASSRVPGGLPNALTLASLGLGFLAVLDTGRGEALAEVLLALAALAEALAGRAARGWKLDSPLGAELDALASLMVWGLAVPVLVLVRMQAEGWTWGAEVLTAGLCLTAAWRLSRGNGGSAVFRGLPLQASGLLLAAAAILGAPAWALGLLALGLAALQLGPWSYPRIELPAWAAAPLFLSLAAAALPHGTWGWILPGAAAAAYALAGPFFPRR